MSKKKRSGGMLPQETKLALGRQVSGEDGRPAKGVQAAMLRVLGVQRPLVLAYVKRLKAKRPQATAAQLIAIAERDYLRTVTGTGAAGGATAVLKHSPENAFTHEISDMAMAPAPGTDATAAARPRP